jgi:membrane protease YdiL (CAAX protease family)
MIMFFAIFTVFTVGIIAFVFGPGLLDGLTELTKGLVQRALLPNIAIILVFIYGLLIVYGKLRPRDLGLERVKVLQAACVIALVILVLQISSTVMNIISYKTLTLGNLWSKVSSSTALGILICQMFVVAFQEEVIFRGFLMPQVYLRIKKDNYIVKMALALVISQGLFAVWHIPIRIFSGMSLISTIISIFTVFMLGIIFALIYIRTGNIFIVMGMHGLWNAVQATSQSNLYIIIMVLIMVTMIFQGPRLQKLKKLNNIQKAKESL